MEVVQVDDAVAKKKRVKRKRVVERRIQNFYDYLLSYKTNYSVL